MTNKEFDNIIKDKMSEISQVNTPADWDVFSENS